MSKLVVVFTGVMKMTRDLETEKFKKLGLEVRNTVTKKTDILIKGHNPGYGKLNKAEAYNTSIMLEDEFFDWLRQNKPEYFL